MVKPVTGYISKGITEPIIKPISLSQQEISLVAKLMQGYMTELGEEYRPKGEYAIRIPVDMVQHTDKNGYVRPMLFDIDDIYGETTRYKISRIVSITNEHERSSGTVGDRYEVDINGKRELLYYTKLQPRKWFMIVTVSEETYNRYYKMPNEEAWT